MQSLKRLTEFGEQTSLIPPYESLDIGIQAVGTSSPRDGRRSGKLLRSHSLDKISVRVGSELFDMLKRSDFSVM
jgi:hypothetical protein